MTDFYCKSCWKFRPTLGAKMRKDAKGRDKTLCASCVPKIKVKK